MSFTVNDFIGELQSGRTGSYLRGLGHNPDLLVSLLRKYSAAAEPMMGKVHAGLVRRGLVDAYTPVSLSYAKRGGRGLQAQGGGGEWESPAAGHDRLHAARPLTDREGWTQLAGLVSTALADQPPALQEALRNAFLEEAAKAA